MLRRLLIALFAATVATGLAACGKKGSPLPPGDSDFPRAYPNPSVYPQPNAPSGTTQRNQAPEQAPAPTLEDNEDTYGFNPGRMTR